MHLCMYKLRVNPAHEDRLEKFEWINLSSMRVYIYIYTYEGGRVLLTEIPLPRIARQRIGCLTSTRGSSRKARMDKFELDEGFQPCHPPFRIWTFTLYYYNNIM